jgi:hypothetical protein
VQHVVDRAGDVDVLGDVNSDQSEAVVLEQVLDVRRRAGQEVVETDDLIAIGQEPLTTPRAQPAVAANESGWPWWD